MRLQAKAPGDDCRPRPSTSRSSFDEALGERQEAYERLLDDAIDGDARRFARADAVEEAWRVVQPVLDDPAADPPLRGGDVGSVGRRPPGRALRRLARPRGA